MINFKGVIDTTLRDGQQSPLLYDSGKYRFKTDEKILILEGLINLGVKKIELFSPEVNESENTDFRQIKKHFSGIKYEDVQFLAHCRFHEKDIRSAINAGFHGLNLYIGISPHAQKFSLQKNQKETISMVKKTLKRLRQNYPRLYLRISTEDAFRTAQSEVFQFFDEVSQYADTLGIPDTVGIATPGQAGQFVRAMKKRYHGKKLECHFHNDRGMSVINSLTAIENGAEYVDASIWGLAERSGITSVTGLFLNLYHQYPKLTNKFNLQLAYPLNVLMGSILNMQVPYSEPVSLTNRTHIAGVHQKAVLNNGIVYEANCLDKFGVNRNQLLFGQLSGWNLLSYYLNEIENLEVSKETVKDISREFKKLTSTTYPENNPSLLLKNIIGKYKLKKRKVPANLSEKRYENLDISTSKYASDYS